MINGGKRTLHLCSANFHLIGDSYLSLLGYIDILQSEAHLSGSLLSLSLFSLFVLVMFGVRKRLFASESDITFLLRYLSLVIRLGGRGWEVASTLWCLSFPITASWPCETGCLLPYCCCHLDVKGDVHWHVVRA
jgi:hypothetical protein